MPIDKDTQAEYRELSTKLTVKLIDNIVKTLTTGECPDLYWKLEKTILEALKYADTKGALRAKKELEGLIKDFDSQDGSTQN
jgi:hypothetical protein